MKQTNRLKLIKKQQGYKLENCIFICIYCLFEKKGAH